MKHLLFSIAFFILLTSCSTTKTGNLSTTNSSIEQVFIAGPGTGLSSSCYAKMKKGNEILWTEIICENRRTKNLYSQIQTDLVRLKYNIDQNELDRSEIGETTKIAIKAFQVKNNMAFGNLDWATVNRLKIKG